MNPPFPLPWLLLLLVVGGMVGMAASWRSTRGLTGSRRGLLLGLRGAALCGLAVILLNPGRWVRPTDHTQRPWIVLTDTSSSMARASGAGTRYSLARDFANKAAKEAKATGLPVRLQAFDDSLHPAADTLPDRAEGKASNILHAIETAFQESSAAGEAPAGMLVISDGRQTGQAAAGTMEALALRARAREVPVHTLAIGANDPVADLSLRAARPTLHVFAGQSVRVPVVLESTGLGALRSTVILNGADGKELARQTIDLTEGKPGLVTFEIPAPATNARWSITTAEQEGEARPGNNQAAVTVRVLTSKTRVFLAEGAPYWDSKFLAQLLRQQKHMDVHSVHRLSDQRYFRIDSGQAAPTETSQAIFPESADELARYDLIVFGRNIDSFLTPARLDALRAYVRDHGGAVLFSRGKPTGTEVAGLDTLEPVAWANTVTADFRFAPNAEGEAAGLFGEALPAANASVWNSLPRLKDGRSVAAVKPFTRILADGIGEQGGKFPVLLVRRYGQGVTGLVNGDGLWKWDFYPEARELGNMYEDYWTQLIQWMASYSEFLPGQDFSLHLASSQGDAGKPVAVSIAYRGPLPAPAPVLRLSGPDGGTTEVTPAAITDPSGRPRWQATLTPSAAGVWHVALVDSRPQAPPAPEVELTVPAPPAEGDDLSPDPAFLAALSTNTGGQSIDPTRFDTFLREHLHTAPPSTIESGAVWQPAWNHALFALGLAILPATEWFLRRRQGLA
ncbi:hypothetical protein KBB96_00305 [Luteolibacter ambystomatis]|uniref:VWA domain-containing protein n=1 Tax=Luteolibacter ambystomatis TaxID=2824561 RepID=A0A975IZS7_9BACT|nr:hypothetical protein [Luteolibacter ambystomatis]QUE51358.1 hypothetical protein KBB96_00305 [Luteolibacter ambystomatis]